ncbi:MAG: hypothetical protein EOO47_02555 [Flavobacterium sp.]|nr:MAG: hypothetical protein EOO47_02555 [Flavobacterium sp.]
MKDFLILPLYSPVSKAYGEEPVPQHTHLNRWNNLGGQDHDPAAVFSIPIILSHYQTNFFPAHKKRFTCLLPNGENVEAHVCADCHLFYVHQPQLLDAWLLQTVLQLEPGQLLSYQHLNQIGVDAIILTKKTDHYTIEVAELNAYEHFLEA